MKIKLFLFLLALSYNSISRADNLSLEEYTRKLDKIDRLEKDLNILQKQFYRNNKNNKSTLDDPSSNLNVNSESRIDAIEEQMRSLTGEIEKLEHLIQIQEDSFKKFSEDIEFRLREKEQQKELKEEIKEKSENNLEVILKDEKKDNISSSLGTVNIKETEKVKLGVQKKQESGQINFDQAFGLVKANKFKEAEEEFKKIVEQNKSDEITARSLYWLGEIYIAKKNFEQSAIYFLQSYKKLPKHNKAPESLLKLANSLRQLKKNSEACTIISKMYKEFPNLDDKLNNRVQEEVSKLGCIELKN